MLGANRRQLITQFLGESVLIAAIAMLLALALVELLLPALLRLPRCRPRACTISAGTACCCRSLGLTLLVGAAGGLYPAFYLSPLPAGAGAEGEQVVGRGGGLRAGSATSSSSPSSRSRSASSSAPRWSTPRPSTRAPPIPATPRRPAPGRGYRPPPAARPLGETLIAARSSGSPASSRSAAPSIGVATRNSTQHRRPGARPARAGQRSATIRSTTTSSGRWGSGCVAGRLFDESRPMDDATLPFPADAGRAARAGRARGVNVVINELAARRMGFRDPARGGRQDRARGDGRRANMALVPVTHHRRGPGFALPLDPRADRSDHVPDRPDRRRRHARPLRRRRSAAVRAGVEQVWKRLAPDVPFDGRVQRGHHRRALQGRGGAGEGVRRLRPARGHRRLPRPVRPRRLHRRAADQGDRHPQGARRAHPRHRPAARLAILQAGDRRQSDRLAGRLVGDARLAEHVRRAHRPRAGAVRARRRCSRWSSRSAPSPATPSRSRGPIRSTRCATNRSREATRSEPCGAITDGRRPGAGQEQDLCLHQHLRPGDRPRRLPDAAPLRPLRDQLRPVAAQCGEHLPVPDPLPDQADRRGGRPPDDRLRRRPAAARAISRRSSAASTRCRRRAGDPRGRRGAVDRGRAAGRRPVLRRAPIPVRRRAIRAPRSRQANASC